MKYFENPSNFIGDPSSHVLKVWRIEGETSKGEISDGLQFLPFISSTGHTLTHEQNCSRDKSGVHGLSHKTAATYRKGKFMCHQVLGQKHAWVIAPFCPVTNHESSLLPCKQKSQWWPHISSVIYIFLNVAKKTLFLSFYCICCVDKFK